MKASNTLWVFDQIATTTMKRRKKNRERRRRRRRRRREIEKLIVVRAVRAERGWRRRERVERVEIVAKDVFQQNDQEFSTTTRTRELIEKQARKKQARLKEKKEQFTEKEWVRWVREEAKKCGRREDDDKP